MHFNMMRLCFFINFMLGCFIWKHFDASDLVFSRIEIWLLYNVWILINNRSCWIVQTCLCSHLFQSAAADIGRCKLSLFMLKQNLNCKICNSKCVVENCKYIVNVTFCCVCCYREPQFPSLECMSFFNTCLDLIYPSVSQAVATFNSLLWVDWNWPTRTKALWRAGHFSAW